MATTENWTGRSALMVSHCAGMIDLVALPVWVGTLVDQYGLDPQRAGGLATTFLLGAVFSSVVFSRLFHRIRPRLVTPLAFLAASLAFFCVPLHTAYLWMAAFHGLAGLAVGCGLSFTHGTIGRSQRPHRLFAIVGTALGLFSVVFLGVTPKLVAAGGGPVLFHVFALLMLAASIVGFIAFPVTALRPGDHTRHGPPVKNVAVTFCVLGIIGMAFIQAMTFSFLQTIGVDRGFGLSAVTGVFIALGIVNLFPAPLAALLEKRWSARRVVLTGPLLQAAIALVITGSPYFAPYAAAAVVFAGVMIFTHTFAFGMLARLDISGRAVAATPAMLMVGSATGPVLGGTFVKYFGYGGLGVAACVVAAAAIAAFMLSTRSSPQWHQMPVSD